MDCRRRHLLLHVAEGVRGIDLDEVVLHVGHLVGLWEGGMILLTEILLPRIARLALNCSTGNCLSNFTKKISSNNSN